MPHHMFAVYDEVTGEITGRIRTNSPQVVEEYKDHKIDITHEEALAAIETTHRVDVDYLRERRAQHLPDQAADRARLFVPKDKKKDDD